MMVFSSLIAAQRAGFQWYAFSSGEKLHIVEHDYVGRGGKRVKALAFARPNPEDADWFAGVTPKSSEAAGMRSPISHH
jgi:hypothetical protein